MINQSPPGSSEQNGESLSQRIHLLPEHLVDQIKAGEVIERPASLIKEIIENALDAHPTQIDLHLINNGFDLISIEDDGDGMTFEDLPYAFCRHATSKISRFEDLYNLHSFGFRGEALASIAAIAKVTCTSAIQENHKQGGKIVFHAGETKTHERQENLRKGTSLYIKDLFFNTPARLKFIKSAQSEKNALRRTIDSFILANPHVRFTVKWDDQDKEVFSPTDDHSKRVARLFDGRKKNPEVYSFEGEYEGHKVWGYLSKNSTRGNAHKKHFLYGNQRLFTDRQIHQTILRSSEGIYPQGESGHYCVFLKVPEQLIDVNVHPNKTQIKFFKLSVLTALLSSEIKKLRLKSNAGEIQESFIPRPERDFNPPSSESSLTENAELFAPAPRSKDNFQPQRIISQAPHHESDYQIIGPHLVSKSRMMKTILSHLSETSFNQDSDFIPLMICEPIEFNSSSMTRSELLEKLERAGLQCEFLSDQQEETLVLRGYHQIYNGFIQIEKLAQVLCHWITGQSHSFSELFVSQNFITRLDEAIPQRKDEYCLSLDEAFAQRNFKSPSQGNSSQ